ncbi:hypothetical protein V6N12_009294 [Hibiscus sabdariffa]|uniref:Uncharacterized protein n=1 Tax=Hibiscus sabdariffa TaxID=183260 RepID=A0ABR2AVV9_9ROSI
MEAKQFMNGFNNSMSGGYLNPLWEKADASTDAGFDLFGDFQFGGSSKNPFLNDDSSDVNLLRNTEIVVPSNGSLDSMDTSNDSKSNDIS